MEIVELIGRLLFATMFVLSGIAHFRAREGMVAYARSSGTPAPELAVPLSGAVILAGGLMVALGAWPDLGALLLVAFLVPTALLMHAYWKVDDPMMRANQNAHFMKNLSLAGAALALFAFYVQCGAEAAYLLRGPLF